MTRLALDRTELHEIALAVMQRIETMAGEQPHDAAAAASLRVLRSLLDRLT